LVYDEITQWSDAYFEAEGLAIQTEWRLILAEGKKASPVAPTLPGTLLRPKSRNTK